MTSLYALHYFSHLTFKDKGIEVLQQHIYRKVFDTTTSTPQASYQLIKKNKEGPAYLEYQKNTSLLIDEIIALYATGSFELRQEILEDMLASLFHSKEVHQPSAQIYARVIEHISKTTGLNTYPAAPILRNIYFSFMDRKITTLKEQFLKLAQNHINFYIATPSDPSRPSLNLEYYFSNKDNFPTIMRLSNKSQKYKSLHYDSQVKKYHLSSPFPDRTFKVQVSSFIRLIPHTIKHFALEKINERTNKELEAKKLSVLLKNLNFTTKTPYKPSANSVPMENLVNHMLARNISLFSPDYQKEILKVSRTLIDAPLISYQLKLNFAINSSLLAHLEADTLSSSLPNPIVAKNDYKNNKI